MSVFVFATDFFDESFQGFTTIKRKSLIKISECGEFCGEANKLTNGKTNHGLLSNNVVYDIK